MEGRKLLKITVIAHLVFVLSFSFSQAAVPQIERDALVALYNSTDGANWTENGNWLTGDPCENSWFGVTCSTGNTTVQRLELGYNQLIGSIPPELGNLSSLIFLYLPFNQLSGSIPSELGNLSSLFLLYLDDNQLSGSIPSELGNLSSLGYIKLHSNQLIGSIPSEIGNLSSLKYIKLHSNQLSGSIPSELGNLSSLKWLFLNSNKLLGTIPTELQNLTNLLDNYSDFRWNALHTNDFMLRAFLSTKQVDGDWEGTQTVAPNDVTAGLPAVNSVQINWTPITYTSDSGGYELYYSETQGGPYTYFDITSDKTFSSMEVTNLYPEITYYFVVQTVTYPHSANQNTVRSEESTEVSETTLPSVPTLGTIGLFFLLSGMSLFLARKKACIRSRGIVIGT